MFLQLVRPWASNLLIHCWYWYKFIWCILHTGSCTSLESAADESQLLETESKADTNNATENRLDDKPDVCDKRFAKKRSLRARRKRHIALKVYSCTQCKKRFSFKSNLYHHMNIHTGKYKCTECDKCCGSNRDLVLHRCNRSDKELFNCTVCSKEFKTSFELGQHSKVHSGEKLYKCPMCDQAFSHSGIRNIHMKVHTGDKLYSGSQSNKSFSQACDLQKRPCSVQTNKRSFPCPYCRKLFKTTWNLKRHVRIHTAEKRYSCRQCSDCFMWDWQLKQHLLNLHSEGMSLICDFCQKIRHSCKFKVRLSVFEHEGMTRYVFSE